MVGITIRTPSRIHFGLFDLNGSLGRVDGGVGVSLNNPGFELEVMESDKVLGDHTDISNFFLHKFGLDGGVDVRVHNIIPTHVGLGSRTQLYLAIGSAISKLYSLGLSTRDIAKVAHRGGTSGIGVEAFHRGGFILDAGHSFGEGSEKRDFLPSHFSHCDPAPVVVRYNIPDSWRFVCVIPSGEKVSGSKEKGIFQTYCPIPRSEVEAVGEIIIRYMLPAVYEQNISEFGESLSELQKVGFKRIELNLQPERVKDLINYLQSNSYGAGLSSFGPLCYALVDGDKSAKALSEDLLARYETVFISQPNNEGAKFS